MKIVEAKCKHCGAELSFDSGKTILFCPYCGTKLLVIDGDEVKVEQVRADAYREVELAREETKRERDRQEHEREKEIIEKGDNVRIELERLKSERQAERERRRHEQRMQKLRYKHEKEQDQEGQAKRKRRRCVEILVSNLFTILSMIVVLIGLFQSRNGFDEGNPAIALGGIMLIISAFLSGRENERLSASMGTMIASLVLMGLSRCADYLGKIGFDFDDIENFVLLLGAVALVVSLVNVIRKAKKEYLDNQ